MFVYKNSMTVQSKIGHLHGSRSSWTILLSFLTWVEQVIAGVRKAVRTKQCYAVKIDTWFGQRWLWFYQGPGSVGGDMALRNPRLTLCTAVQSFTRVVSQRRLLPKWRSASGLEQRIHVHGNRAVQNMQRPCGTSSFHEASAFLVTKRRYEGKQPSPAYMAYVLTREGHWPRYTRIAVKRETWEVVEALGILKR
jgi:hypothetical protein